MAIDLRQYDFFNKLIQLAYIEKIILFGSRARGDNQERADIDIAIVCPQATEEDWLTVLKIIDEADTLLEIDCVRMDSLDNTDSLKSSIEKEGIVVYEQ